MFNKIDLDVDFNGIVIFDYPKISDFFGGKIYEGQNILSEFTSSEKGDIVLDEGAAWPIMGVDDGKYFIRFFIESLPSEKDRKVSFVDDFFYLNVTGNLYVADMAVFWDWEDLLGWKDTKVPKGSYKAKLEGISLKVGNDIEYGYDLILKKVDALGRRTVEPRSDSRII